MQRMRLVVVLVCTLVTGSALVPVEAAEKERPVCYWDFDGSLDDAAGEVADTLSPREGQVRYVGESELPGAFVEDTGPAEWEETVSMDALFDFNSYSLHPEASSIIQRLAQRIRAATGLLVVIEAHSDDVGTQEYNLWLGTKRAGAVRDALVRLGARGNMLKVLSYGKLLPVASNDSEDGRFQNRRLVIKAIRR